MDRQREDKFRCGLSIGKAAFPESAVKRHQMNRTTVIDRGSDTLVAKLLHNVISSFFIGTFQLDGE